MRTTLFNMVAALLLIAAGAAAQDATTTRRRRPAGRAEGVGRDEPGHSARQPGRLRRPRARRSAPARTWPATSATATCGDGATVDVFRVYKDTDTYRYNLQADHVGYRDQRYSASYMNYGKVKANFEWNQIPLFYSDDHEHAL